MMYLYFSCFLNTFKIVLYCNVLLDLHDHIVYESPKLAVYNGI